MPEYSAATRWVSGSIASIGAERLGDRLGEAEVPDRARDAAVLDQEGAVLGHAGQDRLLGVDDVDVVETSHPHAALDADSITSLALDPGDMNRFQAIGPNGFGAGSP